MSENTEEVLVYRPILDVRKNELGQDETLSELNELYVKAHVRKFAERGDFKEFVASEAVAPGWDYLWARTTTGEVHLVACVLLYPDSGHKHSLCGALRGLPRA